jgi:nitrogen fixation/metabolism regulation signal transduction histidine kinase
MKFGQADTLALNRVLNALANGMQKAETTIIEDNPVSGRPAGRHVVGYYIKDNQVRIDIIDKGEVKNG